MRILVLVSALALLAGCQTGGFGGGSLPTAAEIDTKDDADCAKMGAPSGSTGYTACRLKLRDQRIALQDQDQQRRIAGAALIQASRPVRIPPRQCVTTPIGGSVQTSCY